MDIQQYLDNIGIDGQNIIMKDVLSSLGDGLFHLFYNWRICYDNKDISEVESVSQCILQIIICKIRTLVSMCEGIKLISDNLPTKVLDIPSMMSVLRSLYEATFVFHNIYAEQNSILERELVFNIWKIRGFNNRQNLQYVPGRYRVKEKNEKEQIDEIKTRILTLASKLEISESIMQQLRKVISSNSVDIKGYKFKKDNKSKIISFDSIRFEQGTEGLVGNSLMPLYRFLSIHGHPSFLGVLQFGQMFNSNDDIKFLEILLTIASRLASVVAVDFCDNIIGAKDIYDNLPEMEKKYIQVCYVN